MMSGVMKSSPWSSKPVCKAPDEMHAAIPVVHETPTKSPPILNGRSAKISSMEKRMDDEAEDVLKNWGRQRKVS